MLRSIFLFAIQLGILSTAPASSPQNVLLICIDDLRPELGCYGKEYIASPNIDRLAAQGRRFTRHYVQAPSCGPSRYSILTGRFGNSKIGNNALFQRAEKIDAASPSLPAWFRKHGYATVSVGKVSHHPGGRGGPNWDNDNKLEMPLSWDTHLMPSGPWKHPRGAMHGLADGEIRSRKKQTMAVMQSHTGPDKAYPDGWITETGITELRRLSKESKPFFLAIGLIRPHLPFGAPARYMEPYHKADLPDIPHPQKPAGRTTWQGSNEFRQYDHFGRNAWSDPEFALELRKHYAACVSYVDAAVGRILAELEGLGRADDTIIVLWGDHGFHLGEHAVWGKHTLFEESLHSPLIIRRPQNPNPGKASDQIVESVDIFPTLCELAELPNPTGLSGQSLAGLVNGAPDRKDSALSHWRGHQSLRTDRYRLIVHRDGFAELYDHQSPAGETVNLAESKPEVLAALKKQLEEKVRSSQ